MTPNDPTPLRDYYDDLDLHSANLDAFDPSTRLDAARNGGEASILVSGVHLLGGGQLAADLAPDGLAAQQASEVGISHAGLLRNLVNAALLRADLEKAERIASAAQQMDPPKPTKGKRGSKKTAAAAGGTEAVGTSSDSDSEEASGVTLGWTAESLLGPRLPPLPPLDMYSRSQLFPVTPDTWDLLQSLRARREEQEIMDVADEAELEEEVDEVRAKGQNSLQGGPLLRFPAFHI